MVPRFSLKSFQFIINVDLLLIVIRNFRFLYRPKCKFSWKLNSRFWCFSINQNSGQFCAKSIDFIVSNQKMSKDDILVELKRHFICTLNCIVKIDSITQSFCPVIMYETVYLTWARKLDQRCVNRCQALNLASDLKKQINISWYTESQALRLH